MSEKYHRKSIRFRKYDYSRTGFYFVTISTYYKDHLFGEIVEDKINLNDAGKFVNKCWNDITTHYPDVELDSYIIMPNHVHGIIIINNDKNIGINNNNVGVGAKNIGCDDNNVGVQNFEPHQKSDDNQFVNVGKNIGDNANVGVQNFEPLHQPHYIEHRNHNNNKYKQTQRNEYQHIIPKSLGAIVRGFKIGVTKWIRQNTSIHNVWQRNYYEHIIRNDEEFYKIRNYIKTNPKNWKYDRYF